MLQCIVESCQERPLQSKATAPASSLKCWMPSTRRKASPQIAEPAENAPAAPEESQLPGIWRTSPLAEHPQPPLCAGRVLGSFSSAGAHRRPQLCAEGSHHFCQSWHGSRLSNAPFPLQGPLPAQITHTGGRVAIAVNNNTHLPSTLHCRISSTSGTCN